MLILAIDSFGLVGSCLWIVGAVVGALMIRVMRNSNQARLYRDSIPVHALEWTLLALMTAFFVPIIFRHPGILPGAIAFSSFMAYFVMSFRRTFVIDTVGFGNKGPWTSRWQRRVLQVAWIPWSLVENLRWQDSSRTLIVELSEFDPRTCQKHLEIYVGPNAWVALREELERRGFPVNAARAAQ